MAAELLVGVCVVSPQQMVQMRNAGDGKAVGFGHLAQHVHERDRIRSSG